MVMLSSWPSLCLLASVLASCNGEDSTPSIDPSKPELSCDAILEYAFPDLCELETARGQMEVRGLSLAYWRYRRKGGENSGLPLVIVHGGPAFSHHYMLPLKQQACRGREVVFYDQGGAGESSQPEDVRRTAPWLFTIDYYVEELSALVDVLGWEQFHLLGNSWGTVVAQAYAFTQDPRLHAVVLSGPLSDGQLYGRSQWDEIEGNLGSLPFFVQGTLRVLGNHEAYDSELYKAEDQLLTSFFTVRTTPTPDCFKVAEPTSNTSREIYVGMQGASEFTVGGVLASMNFTPRLHEIRNPVLITHGRFDTMRPPVIDAIYRNLPRAWRALMPRSGHVSMIDDARLMNNVVGDFLAHEELGAMELFRVPPEADEPPRCGSHQFETELGDADGSTNQPTWLLLVLASTVGAVIGSAVTATLLLQHSHLRRRGAAVGSLSAPLGSH